MNNTETRRRFLRTAAVAAAATTLPLVPAIAGEPDPVFALIEAHKAAMAESNELAHKVGSTSFDDCEAHEAASDESADALDRVEEAQLALFTTRPSTLAGAAAVLAYVATFWIQGDNSADQGLPIYEPYASDYVLNAGGNFLPMIANTITRLARTS